MPRAMKKIRISAYLGLTAILIPLFSMCVANKENTGNKTANHVLDAIHARKSVRVYTSQKVTRDQMDVLMSAAMAAPTSGNKQPWAFIAIDDEAILKDFGEEFKSNAAFAATAPAAIVVCGDLSKAYEEPLTDFWVLDCSAASQNILLAAESIGLGAVWTGVYPSEERIEYVREALNLPAHLVPLNMIVIGYPAHAGLPKNKYDANNIFFNGWGVTTKR